MTGPDSDLNISLEPHLVEKLIPLAHVLPSELVAELALYIAEPIPATIPYSLLTSISKWSRSPSGLTTLQSNVPPLNAQDYAMISLLAGSVTSPERHFPTHVSKYVLAEEERKRQITDKKAIVTLLNALLSIAGSGMAAWFAAERWRTEWRVLLSFLVAVTVAASETILYIIWHSRRSRKLAPRLNSAPHKKDGGDKKQPGGGTGAPVLPARNQSTGGQTAGLRYRARNSELKNEGCTAPDGTESTF